LQRAFKTDKEFENKFKEYINYCHDNERMPNVAGFAVFADINQDTFYAQREYYSETFKKVNDMLEDEAINNHTLNDARIIFYMKNKCGYKDRQEIDTNTQGKVTIINSLPKDDEDESND
jgi:hypothetical protein